MYFTANEALQPDDLELLELVLEETRQERGINARDPALDGLASELVNLWLAGFRNADELKAMIQPDLLSQ